MRLSHIPFTRRFVGDITLGTLDNWLAGGIMKIGKDSVVIGNVPSNIQVGDGSVVIGATDSRGNTIINQPLAVGRGAQAGPGSIAIGAFAGAGVAQHQSLVNLQIALQQFAEFVSSQNNAALAQEFEKLKAELKNPEPNRSAVLSAWEGVKAVATIDGALNLLTKTTAALVAYFGGPSA